MSRQADTDRLYDLLIALASATGEVRLLRDATGSTGWPTHGVYFSFEPRELRLNGQPRGRSGSARTRSPGTPGRRCGHGSPSTEAASAGATPAAATTAGRSSACTSARRLSPAATLLTLPLSAWLADRPSPEYREAELACERRVSAYIGEMPVVCLPVPSTATWAPSDRGLVEATCISLLSAAAGGVDRASDAWLGRHAGNPAISASGLWNARHVTGEYDPAVLDLLQDHVEAPTGRPG